MAHEQQKEFCLNLKSKYPQYFVNLKVLDVGSLDINGNNKVLFDNCEYSGLDIGPGLNVDIVSKAHEFKADDHSYDVIISTECFEHDMYYSESINNIIRMLKPQGMFIFTCATTGRAEHGTLRTSPQAAPLLNNYDEWNNYYKNLTESDIRNVCNLDEKFTDYKFEINDYSHDLYFFGIKK